MAMAAEEDMEISVGTLDTKLCRDFNSNTDRHSAVHAEML